MIADGLDPEIKAKIIRLCKAVIPDAEIWLYGSRARRNLDRKLENLNKMIAALERSIKKLDTAKEDELEFFQDSVVARFKILIESTWKNMALILHLQGFADLPASPKGIIAFAVDAKMITPHEADSFSKLLILRNLATHLYDQPQYILVVNAASGALSLVKKFYQRMLMQQTVLG